MADQEMQDQYGRMPQYEDKAAARESEDRYQRNPLGFLMLAFALFWLGVYLLLRNRHIFPDTDRSWAYLLCGLSALAWLEFIFRLIVPKWRRYLVGIFAVAAVWTGAAVGLWNGGGWVLTGLLVLIAISMAVVVNLLVTRR